jgi:hypothetical protein
MDPSLGQSLAGIWQALIELFAAVALLVAQLGALATHFALLIVWVVWWLFAVNWKKAWPALGSGGWAPVILLMLIGAFTWSRLQQTRCDCLSIIVIPNFWWQLGYVSMLVALALFCGWLQGVLRWTPPEINFEPPVHEHADAHGHAAHH